MKGFVAAVLGTAVPAIAFAGIAIGRLPRLRMNRATIAFSGAAILVLGGIFGLDEALAAVDGGTLVLILSMMVLSANLKLAGFFDLAAVWLEARTAGPRRTLALVMGAAAVLSALFLNDTICIMMTPVVLSLTLKRGRAPVPYLIGLATAANIGSAATIVGNPQNMLIGAASGIPFLRFLALLGPPSALSLLAAYLIVMATFRDEFGGLPRPGESLDSGGRPSEASRSGPGPYRPLLLKCGIASAVMILAFVSGVPVAAAAAGGAAILLITRRIKPERVFRELDWTIIVFFSGLFVLSEAVSRTPAFSYLVGRGASVAGRSPVLLAAFTALISNLVSNVPAVMLMRPLVPLFADPERTWLTLAMASTYAGNLTLVGSVANLIVAEGAKTRGVELSFGSYFKAGAPITLATIAIGTAWLAVVP